MPEIVSGLSYANNNQIAVLIINQISVLKIDLRLWGGSARRVVGILKEMLPHTVSRQAYSIKSGSAVRVLPCTITS